MPRKKIIKEGKGKYVAHPMTLMGSLCDTTRRKSDTQSKEELEKIEKESMEQALPKQRKVLSAADKIKRKTTNLPDPTHTPLYWKDGKGYDHIYPWIRIPRLHPKNHGDTVIFNAPELPANQLILGDNLEVLRTLPGESIDLIYIDPPFFSGEIYNVIWGDTNEVRTFYDIWEGGIDSYLVWLNARLLEMRRVLKKTGSIYVHCDWHASHYIKTEMDKIFGYENFRNEIIWHYRRWSAASNNFQRMHDIIFWYSKSDNYIFTKPLQEYAKPEWIEDTVRGVVDGKLVRLKDEKGNYIKRDKENEGVLMHDVWEDVNFIGPTASERLGYPTQKPIELLQRIIETSSNPGDAVADFFVGGGTMGAVALGQRAYRKKKTIKRKDRTIEEKEEIIYRFDGAPRRFIGCDSSRVAISVTLDRLVKVGEEMSGVKSNVAAKEEKKQFGLALQESTLKAKVPNIELSYLGVYPIEKFEDYPQEDFVNFVLTCYGASKNTAEGITNGYRPPGQSEPILVGPSNSKESIGAKTVKKFFDEIKSKLELNKLISAKIISWRFSRQIVKYIKILEQYIEKNNLPVKLELIPLDSKEFRARILQRYPDANEAEFFLRFSKAPVIGDIKVKKIKDLEYEFEAIDAFSINEDGWLVNCQWDFDYQKGHFCADKDYILSREKKKYKKRGEIFKAILKAKHKFKKFGEYTVACKVQDNLAGETIFSKVIIIK